LHRLKLQRPSEHAGQLELYVLRVEPQLSTGLRGAHCAGQTGKSGRTQHRLQADVIETRLQRVLRRLVRARALHVQRQIVDGTAHLQSAQVRQRFAFGKVG
jgi:hypothetical protein